MWTRASRASCIWKASRAGSSNSSAAPWRTTRRIDLVSILRTAPNKLYRQGVYRPGDTAHPPVNGKCSELEDGFPTKVEDLFGFDGLIFGSVDAPYLTQASRS